MFDKNENGECYFVLNQICFFFFNLLPLLYSAHNHKKKKPLQAWESMNPKTGNTTLTVIYFLCSFYIDYLFFLFWVREFLLGFKPPTWVVGI